MKAKEFFKKYWWIILIVVLIILGLLYYFLIYKPAQEERLSEPGEATTKTCPNGMVVPIDSTCGFLTNPLSVEELNPANYGKLLYAKINNPYITLADGTVDTSKLQGNYLGLINLMATGYTASSPTWTLTNGSVVYKNQSITDTQLAVAGRG